VRSLANTPVRIAFPALQFQDAAEDFAHKPATGTNVVPGLRRNDPVGRQHDAAQAIEACQRTTSILGSLGSPGFAGSRQAIPVIYWQDDHRRLA